MPAKPSWCNKINSIVAELERYPQPFVDRAAVEFLLGVGRRRAQQILAPCISSRVGSSGVADRALLIRHLRLLATGYEGQLEHRRRLKVARALASPPLLVEASSRVERQEFANLPAGVRMDPGRITVTFDKPQQALERLLALAMAIRNDFTQFERLVTHPSQK